MIGYRPDLTPNEPHWFEIEATTNPMGLSIRVPFCRITAPTPGPIVTVTGVVHGDELNGAAVIHELLHDKNLKLRCGELVLCPVVNMPALNLRSRYLQDRRDLNRCFPGQIKGSQAGRYAAAVFDAIIRPANYLIDLHTGGSQRTNMPNFRVDLDDAKAVALAEAAAPAILVHSKGTVGSLRREASRANVTAVTLEAGETQKFEEEVVRYGKESILNMLSSLEMISRRRRKAQSVRVRRTVWLRAPIGGIARLTVGAGDAVAIRQRIAVILDVAGRVIGEVKAPFSGLVIGLNADPICHEGDALLHLARPVRGGSADAFQGRKDPHGLLSDVAQELRTRVHLWPEEGGGS